MSSLCLHISTMPMTILSTQSKRSLKVVKMFLDGDIIRGCVASSCGVSLTWCVGASSSSWISKLPQKSSSSTKFVGMGFSLKIDAQPVFLFLFSLKTNYLEILLSMVLKGRVEVVIHSISKKAWKKRAKKRLP